MKNKNYKTLLVHVTLVFFLTDIEFIEHIIFPFLMLRYCNVYCDSIPN